MNKHPYILILAAMLLALPFQNARAQDPHNTGTIKDKLDHIIIPKLELKEATLPDAIDFLHKASVELDTTEKDPARKGVNFVLKLPVVPAASGTPAAGDTAPAPGVNSIADVKITLKLSNIPLSVALTYVTKLAGMKYKINPYAVTIVPLSENTDVLVTKEYKVPADFLTRTRQPGSSTKLTALELLKDAGVVFPEGASANFLPGSSKLVVRNTEDNLDLVDQIVDNINSAPSPSPAEDKK